MSKADNRRYLLQAAVASDDIGAMINEFGAVVRAENALGERHADRRGKSLAERPCRRLHADGVAIFRMTVEEKV